MKTDFVIQIIQLCQFRTKSANTDFFLVLVFQILTRFYKHIDDKNEMFYHNIFWLINKYIIT